MKKLIKLLFGVGIFIGIFYFVLMQVNEDQSATDSDALYGGQLELGYPEAGFLISYEPGGGSKTCGFAVLNNTLAVTAAHCVDNSERIYIGKGNFTTNPSSLVEVVQATQKDGWVNNQERSQDFALLQFVDRSNTFTQFAQIASPVEGCSYRVVAYGRTENPDEIFTKPRKSAKMCATEVRDSIFIMTGEEGGICFGDSGSPVFYEGTNRLAGVVASIVLEQPNETNPCAIGNTAIVVRADVNENIINDTLISITNDPDSLISVAEGSTIQLNVASSNGFWAQVGLGNLSPKQQFDYTLYAIFGVIVIISLVLIVSISNARSKPSSGISDYYS